MTGVTLIGLFAATCTTVAFLPQVIKAFKTKRTEDISLWMYLIMIVGLISWLIYGLLIGNLPLILANGITLVFASIIIIFKLLTG